MLGCSVEVYIFVSGMHRYSYSKRDSLKSSNVENPPQEYILVAERRLSHAAGHETNVLGPTQTRSSRLGVG